MTSSDPLRKPVTVYTTAPYLKTMGIPLDPLRRQSLNVWFL